MRDSSTRTRQALRVAITAVTAALLFFVSAVPAWSMTLTFVRHAESQANADGIIDTSVPGPDLTELGQQQAEAVAVTLAGNDYDGVYASSMVRTQQTAVPLAQLLGQPIVVLPGLREISAGIFEGSSEDEGLGRIGYVLAPLAWTLGARFVPVLGGEDGNAFDARVDDAVQQIYNNGDENAVAFSHGATIMFWVMMNVDNPDLGLLLTHPLGNTEAVVIEGSPDEGWTLVSWAGVPVAAEPPLATKLFVNVRNLVTAPQTALYQVGQAFATGDIATLANAIRDGILNVGKAVIGFMPETVRDIVDSVSPTPEAVNATAGTPTVDIAPEAKSAALTASTFAARSPDEVTAAAEPPAEDSESAKDTEAAEKSEARPNRTRTQKLNGATDLTDGNKVEPDEVASGSAERDQSEPSDQLDDVVEDITTDTTADASSDSGASEQAAA